MPSLRIGLVVCPDYGRVLVDRFDPNRADLGVLAFLLGNCYSPSSLSNCGHEMKPKKQRTKLPRCKRPEKAKVHIRKIGKLYVGTIYPTKGEPMPETEEPRQ